MNAEMATDTASAPSVALRACGVGVRPTARCACGAPVSHRATFIRRPEFEQDVCEMGAKVLRGDGGYSVRRLNAADFSA